MEDYLGILPKNSSEGVLQDIHWAMGGIGYFPTYTLGNLYAAQFWNKINHDLPDLMMEISKGDTSSLLKWLREKIHVHGSTYTAKELCMNITGEDLDPKYLTEYLQTKYSNLYGF
jgi:carboxypeptidase Taq